VTPNAKAFIFLVMAILDGAFVFGCIRVGKVWRKYEDATIRAEDPLTFWVFVTFYALIGSAFLAASIFIYQN
jgi:hypothetical protein